MTYTIGDTMTHTETLIELSVKEVIEAYGFARTTFESWRDAVYSGVGDPPYSKSELRIIFEYAETVAARAFGNSRNKNTKKIARILRSL